MKQINSFKRSQANALLFTFNVLLTLFKPLISILLFNILLGTPEKKFSFWVVEGFLLEVITHNDLNKYFHHYFIEDLKKTKKIEKVKYIQGSYLGRTNIDPGNITRGGSENSENTSSDEDNVSKSEEDIVLNNNALSSDSSSWHDVDEENEHTAE